MGLFWVDTLYKELVCNIDFLGTLPRLGSFSYIIVSIASHICDIEGECSKKIHFKNVIEITKMNLKRTLKCQMKSNMVP